MKTKAMRRSLYAVLALLLSLPVTVLAQVPSPKPTTPTGVQQTTGGSGWNISNVTGFGLPKGQISTIITNILTWLLMGFGIIGIIGFLIAGILYLTAAGDDDQIKRAKKAMTFSIVGVIVGLVGVVVIQAVHAALNANPDF